jgi:hypothetical protein
VKPAQYYIYRNLNKGLNFSVKYRGRVIASGSHITATDVQFKVSAAGRARVLQEHKRNVHAYAVCADWNYTLVPDADQLSEVSYNPYKAGQFQVGGVDILSSPIAHFKAGRCYVPKG